MEYEEHIPQWLFKVENVSHPEAICIERPSIEHIIQKYIYEICKSIERLDLWRHIEEKYTQK